MSEALSYGRLAEAQCSKPVVRFLLIDDDADYREILRYHIEVEWPGADVVDQQPRSTGRLPAEITLDGYDVVLLGHPIGGETGLDWLAALVARPDCPPVIVFAEPSDEWLAVDALKAGASSYFPKRKLLHRRLVAAVEEAAEHGRSVAPSRTHSPSVAAVTAAEGPAGSSGLPPGEAAALAHPPSQLITATCDLGPALELITPELDAALPALDAAPPALDAAMSVSGMQGVSAETVEPAASSECTASRLDQPAARIAPALDAAPPVYVEIAEMLAARRQRLVERLHQSDLSSVYLAEHEGTGERLVLKVVQHRPGKAGSRLFERFLLEYELIAALRHPHVVQIFDLGVADDHAYIVMEHFEAGSLADRLAGGALETAHAIEYAREIGAALAAIHTAGIMHRDLKPGNVMFRRDGTLALIDFGLAKKLRLDASLTGTGQIFGTPHYMSPEQGHADATDERSDLYSLGCILYEMLTGEKPFTSSTAMGVIYKHAHAPRPQLPDARAALQPLLDRLLAVDPMQRFQSAAGYLRALDAVAGKR